MERMIHKNDSRAVASLDMTINGAVAMDIEVNHGMRSRAKRGHPGPVREIPVRSSSSQFTFRFTRNPAPYTT